MAIPVDITDDSLLTRAREGDGEAFEVLYRRHRRTATRAAHRYSPRNPHAEDAVQEAFLRILRATQDGRGPTSEFGGYLATTVRHVLAGWARSDRTVPTDDAATAAVLAAVPHSDGTRGQPEGRLRWHLLVRAFRSLPTRWQEALWLGEVEGLDVGELAGRWNMTPAAASALTYRARDGLRTAWLEAHLRVGALPQECRPFAADLPRLSRDRLSEARAAEVSAHVDGCEHCRDVLAELDGASRDLRVALLPVMIWGGWQVLGGSALLGKGLVGFATQQGRRAAVIGSSVSAVAVIAVGGVVSQLPVPAPALPGSPAGLAAVDVTASPSADPTPGSTPDGAATSDPADPSPDATDPPPTAPTATGEEEDDPPDAAQATGATDSSDSDDPGDADAPDDPAGTDGPVAPGPDDADPTPDDPDAGTDPDGSDPDPDDPDGSDPDDPGEPGDPDDPGDPGGPGDNDDPGDGDAADVVLTAPVFETDRPGPLRLQLRATGSGAHPGATVEVVPSLDLGTRTTTVTEDGTWEVTFGLVSSLTGTLTLTATQSFEGRTSDPHTETLDLDL